MFRSASRVIARPTALRALPRASAPTKRFVSTAPPTEKSRSWKSLAARLGAVGAIMYYYNTTDVFAEEPKQSFHALPETDRENEQLQTIEAISNERKRRKAEEAAAAEAAAVQAAASGAGASDGASDGVEQLEAEADQQGAFNPETGEINWDCPCLGGMAHGPCGEEFKSAFSCFVYSTEAEKGIDCIDKFKDMQNCFRQYPEIYGSELERDEVDEALAEQAQPAADTDAAPTAISPEVASPETQKPNSARAESAKEQVSSEHPPLSESETVVPKAAFDQREANEEKN